VLVLVDYYLPGFKAGGPLRSVYNLIDALGDEFRFRLITRDRDKGDRQPYPEARPGEWIRRDKAEVLYLEPGLPGTLRLIRELLRPGTHVIYLNSFFSRKFSMLPAALRYLGLLPRASLLLAPRGEFSPGALGLKSLRKRWFMRVANLIGFYRGCLWHASSAFEAADIEREVWPRTTSMEMALLGQDTTKRLSVFTARPLAFLASDMPDRLSYDQTPLAKRTKQAGAAEFAFLSRIDKMKNLAGAIGMLTSLKGRVALHVYGPCADGGYLAECKSAESNLPSNARVIWHGAIPHSDVHRCLSQHHFFFLPTKGENYGHVIVEAFVAGCPVIVSDRTPWRDLERAGVGWDLPLESPRFAAVLQECVDMEDGRFRDLSVRAAAYGLKSTRQPAVLVDNRKMFLSGIALGETVRIGS
jgi:glycosyltransferase involved in cell wall biosynthesis